MKSIQPDPYLLNPYDVQVGDIWDLLDPRIRRILVIELDIEDAICLTRSGDKVRIWLKHFASGEKLHVAGNWKQNE